MEHILSPTDTIAGLIKGKGGFTKKAEVVSALKAFYLVNGSGPFHPGDVVVVPSKEDVDAMVHR